MRGHHGLELLVIDYIQLLARLLRRQYKGIADQSQILALLVRGLKHLTLTHNNEGMTIFILSQLNRTSLTSIKERIRNPRLSEADRYKNIYDLTSISESSEIVNAADVVVTVFSDDYLKKKKEVVVQIIKNRRGNTLEEGVHILALPEICYIGDIKQEIDPEITAKYIHYLISGKIV